jgi:peptidoglycan/LPS O-acetylase OafA/YrhL
MPPRLEGLLDAEYWKGFSGSEVKGALTTRATRWLVDLVRPSFWSKVGSAGSGKPLRRTAYLDGLRGFAAFMVYCLHHQLWAHETDPQQNWGFENAFGWEGRYYFAAFPGVRLFFAGGHFAVTMFFVISGYVLSAKPLALIHAGEFVKMGDNVGSALFRRWLRLHIPVIGTTFVFLTVVHLFGLKTSTLEVEKTWGAEVVKWYRELNSFTFVFRSGGEPWFSYNFHAWSIPIEFRGSILIYTSLLAFSRCTRNARLWCQVGLIVYFIWIVDGWFCALFTSGMLLCELDLLAANNDLPEFLTSFEPYKQKIFYALFVISIYLGGVPCRNSNIANVRDAWGWHYLSYLKPQAMWDYKWFFLFWASTFLVVSIPRIAWLRAFFETRFCQYLGRISFAFYLVHGPVLWILGDRLYAAVGFTKEYHTKNIPQWVNAFPLPRGGPLGLEPSFLLTHLILLPATLWMAEVATKLFDDPSIRISQWLFNESLPPSEK